MRIGFIGLGSQGAPMARRIVEAGYETTLWARRPETLDPFRDTAARFADTPAKLAAASDLVCLCVVGDADVEEVVTGEQGILGAMADGGIIAVHSTVHPDTCRALAETARERGVAVIDAPVSGGGQAAEGGTLLVMVGGDEDVVARCRPVFATYGNPVVHLGGLGSGQTTKLLNNLLFTANLATVTDTLQLGRALGVDPDGLGRVISRGSAGSFALGSVVAAGGTLDPIASLAGPLLGKDFGLIAELAAAADASAPVVRAAAEAALDAMGAAVGLRNEA